MDWDDSLNTPGWKPPGPVYFVVFNFHNFFSTCSVVKAVFAASRTWYFFSISRMTSISRRSSFALSSLILRSPILLIFYRYDFQYLQKPFGYASSLLPDTCFHTNNRELIMLLVCNLSKRFPDNLYLFDVLCFFLYLVVPSFVIQIFCSAWGQIVG